jgi:hypothetical protein
MSGFRLTGLETQNENQNEKSVDSKSNPKRRPGETQLTIIKGMPLSCCRDATSTFIKDCYLATERTSLRSFAIMDSNSSNNGRPIQRARSHSDANSTASRSGKTRKCHPEKLINVSQRVRPLGTAFVDNGALISAGLASVVANKAFRLRILTENRGTGENNQPYVGQAGLIRGARLTSSPPLQRRAIGDGETYARSSLLAL